MFIWVR